ncbi:MAG: Flp family type IVb pilin [Dehalococcoidia bacterium]
MSKLRNWAVNKAIEMKVRQEEGQGLAEYGLILALIAVVCIAALTLLGTSVSSTLQSINGAL